MNQSSHGIVDGAHHLICHFHNGYFSSGMMKILSHLQSDKTASHNDGTLHLMLVHVLLDAVGIVHIAQGKNSPVFNSGQRRTHRRRTR